MEDNLKNFVDKKLIESIANDDNSSFAGVMQEKIVNLMGNSLSNLAVRVPFINIENTILQPVNETFNGAFTPMSSYIYFLGINSPQMEINSLKNNLNLKKIREKISKAWHDSKRKKSKRRQQKEEEKNREFTDFEPEKYNLESFKHDLQLELAGNLSVTSIVYNLPSKLVIQGKDDFGSVSQIEIIPVIYDGEKFKYFLGKKKGFLEIDMNERLLNFNIKYEIVGENFIKMIKIFNNLFKNITKENVNQIFIESLMYNIPDQLFEGDDIYNVFVNIVNYLNMTDISNFVSIENKTETILKSKILKGAIGLYNKFFRNI